MVRVCPSFHSMREVLLAKPLGSIRCSRFAKLRRQRQAFCVYRNVLVESCLGRVSSHVMWCWLVTFGVWSCDCLTLLVCVSLMYRLRGGPAYSHPHVGESEQVWPCTDSRGGPAHSRPQVGDAVQSLQCWADKLGEGSAQHGGL